MPQWAVSLLRLTTSKTEDGKEIFYLAGNAELTDSERSGLVILLREAEGHLIPAIRDSAAGQKQAIEALTALFRSYLPPSVSEATVGLRAKIMLEVLSDLPAHAIVEAIGLWLKGEAGDYNYGFEPKPPILRQLALSRLTQANSQAHEIKKILAAADYKKPVADEGERQRTLTAIQEWKQYRETSKEEEQLISGKSKKAPPDNTLWERERAMGIEAGVIPTNSITSPYLAKLIQNQNEKIDKILNE